MRAVCGGRGGVLAHACSGAGLHNRCHAPSGDTKAALGQSITGALFSLHSFHVPDWASAGLGPPAMPPPPLKGDSSKPSSSTAQARVRTTAMIAVLLARGRLARGRQPSGPIDAILVDFELAREGRAAGGAAHVQRRDVLGGRLVHPKFDTKMLRCSHWALCAAMGATATVGGRGRILHA